LAPPVVAAACHDFYIAADGAKFTRGRSAEIDRQLSGPKQRREFRPDCVQQQRLRRGGRMDAVVLEKTIVGGDGLQEKRHAGHAVLPRQFIEQRLERCRVGSPVIGRYFHAEQQNPGTRLLRTADDGVQVASNVGNRQSTQPVIAAEFDDHHRGPVRGEGPRQAGERAAGGFAAGTGIDDAVTVPFGAQPSLQQGHPALLHANPICRAEAVAQDQDRGRLGRRRGRVRSPGDDRGKAKDQDGDE
jgi:hypothetical protein